MKKNNFIVICVSLFIIVITLGIACITISNSGLNETDIQVYSGEVESIEKSRIGADTSYRICLKEYVCELFIGQEGANYDLSDVKSGDRITFAIENEYIDTFESNIEIIPDMFVPIVALKTESEEVFSLEEYNHNLEKSFKIPLLFCVVLIVVSLAILIRSLIIIITCRKKTGNNSRKSDVE